MSHERGAGGRGGGVQGPVPADPADARGIRPGEEDGKEDKGPAPERQGEQKGEAEAESQFRDARDNRVDDGDSSRAPELGVSKLVPVVLQPDEGGAALLKGRQAGEACPDLPAERRSEYSPEEQQRQAEQEIGEPDLATPTSAGARAHISARTDPTARELGRHHPPAYKPANVPLVARPAQEARRRATGF